MMAFGSVAVLVSVRNFFRNYVISLHACDSSNGCWTMRERLERGGMDGSISSCLYIFLICNLGCNEIVLADYHKAEPEANCSHY